VKWFCFGVKWSGVTVKFLGIKVPCTLGWTYTEGTWMYCDYFIWYVSCSVFVLTCCVCVGEKYVWVFWQLCGCFGNTCTCTACPTCYRTRLAGGPLLRVATIRRNTDTFLFISHTTNVLLFKFRCNIFIGVRIIKEMQGSVASGTHCIYCILYCLYCVFVLSRLCIFILICSVCSSVRSAAIEWKLNWSKQ